MLGVYDLRLDKMLILSFPSGLEREDWFQAMLGVQDTIKKGLVPVKTFGKTAEEQEEQAKQIMAEQRRLGLDDHSHYASKYSDAERCQMVTAYNEELDENYGLNGYEFVIVMPYHFAGKPKSWVEKRRASQREIIRALRLEKLVCRILKSRDEDELLVLVRAPSYEEFSLTLPIKYKKQKKGKAVSKEEAKTQSTLPEPSFSIMDFYSFWADKLQIEYEVRQVREGFKGCTLPYTFDSRVLFVREGEFNPPDLIKPKRVEMPHRLPGQRKGAAQLTRTENAMRRLGYKLADWDVSITAHNVDHAFYKTRGYREAKMSYSDWRSQQTRLGQMRASSRRQEIIRKVCASRLRPARRAAPRASRLGAARVHACCCRQGSGAHLMCAVWSVCGAVWSVARCR